MKVDAGGDQQVSGQSRKSSPQAQEGDIWRKVEVESGVVSKAVTWELGWGMACSLVCFSVHLLQHRPKIS